MTQRSAPPKGRAQTIVSTAPKAPQKKQQGLRRTKLLPNKAQTQQKNAASSILLGYARVSKAENQDTAPQMRTERRLSCKQR